MRNILISASVGVVIGVLAGLVVFLPQTGANASAKLAEIEERAESAENLAMLATPEKPDEPEETEGSVEPDGSEEPKESEKPEGSEEPEKTATPKKTEKPKKPPKTGGIISPDELIEAVMSVPLPLNNGEPEADRYGAFKKLADENGFWGQVSEMERYNFRLIDLQKLKEAERGDKAATLLRADNGRDRFAYLLFVYENGEWRLDAVEYDETEARPYIKMWYTPKLEEVWLER